MTFAEPQLLWLILLVPPLGVVAWGLWTRRLAAGASWASRGLGHGRQWTSVLLLGCALLGTTLALARPRWGRGAELVAIQGVDLVFVLDASLSMAAQDLRPSRFYVAQTLIRRLLQALSGHPIALVVTEGEATVMAPLTLDGAAVDLLLDTVEPGALPAPGTSLARGLDRALTLLPRGEDRRRAVVLLSDGEDHAGGLPSSIRELEAEGLVAYALGIASTHGARIPLPGGAPGRFKRDPGGEFVVSRLVEATLQDLAGATGGLYLRVESAAADLTPIIESIRALSGDRPAGSTLRVSKERFQWPLGVAVVSLTLFLAFGPFRSQSGAERPSAPGIPEAKPIPSATTALLIACLLSLGEGPPRPVDRWLYNPRALTARGLHSFAARDFEAAASSIDAARRLQPDDPRTQYNAGTLLLTLGAPQAVPLLEQAAETARPSLAPLTYYNLGNAWLATDNPAAAIEAYKACLRIAPDFEDAKFNLELALRRLAPPPPTPPAPKVGGTGPAPVPTPRAPGVDGGETPDAEGEEAAETGQERGEGGGGTLPRFRDQPDMGGKEAAAILEAVENLERQERRAPAKQAPVSRTGAKDW